MLTQIIKKEALDSDALHLFSSLLPDITFGVVTSLRDNDGVASINVCFVGAAVRDGSLEAGTTNVKEVVMLMSQGGHYQLMMLKGGLSVFDVRHSMSIISGHDQDVIALDASIVFNGEWLECEFASPFGWYV